jgi:hypothetical protein
VVEEEICSAGQFKSVFWMAESNGLQRKTFLNNYEVLWIFLTPAKVDKKSEI